MKKTQLRYPSNYLFQHLLYWKRIVILFVLFLLFVTTPQSTPTKADQSTTYPLFMPLVMYTDPISGYLAMLSQSRVTGFTSSLVSNYGPRHYDFHKVFIDRNCTQGGTYYENSNLKRSLNYVKQDLEGLGYPITKEYVGDISGEYNVIAQRTGSEYPNVFIEIGAHIDTKNTTPGASDNAAGVAGVMELATVLKDYPNRYSLRFDIYIGEEYGRTGSIYHTQQIANRGEKVKAALVFDGIGWSEIAPNNMNCIWANSKSESQRIANLFDTIRAKYAINIAWRMCSPDPLPQVSDNVSYWEHNLTSVLSIGGLPYQDPNYHSCKDDMHSVDMDNAFKTIQQNLVVALILDSEDWSTTLMQEQPYLEPVPSWPGEGH